MKIKLFLLSTSLCIMFTFSINAGPPPPSHVVVICNVHGAFEGTTTAHFNNTNLQEVCYNVFGKLSLSSITGVQHQQIHGSPSTPAPPIVNVIDLTSPDCFGGSHVKPNGVSQN